MRGIFDPKADPISSRHFTSRDEESQGLISAG